MLPPFSVAYVKGWRRSVCALIVAEGVRTLDLLEAVSDDYKAGSVAVCVAQTLGFPGKHEHHLRKRGPLWQCTRPSLCQPRLSCFEQGSFFARCVLSS